jgi:transposase, IS5 family
LIHRGKFKSLGAKQRQWLKRRQAIEPAIGHAKSDHRLDRCWLKGADGDALHAVLCAAGFNVRWLLRAIAATGLKGLLLAFSQWALWRRWLASALHIASAARTAPTRSFASRPHHAQAMPCSTQR